jgi:hypothetical protein
MSRGADHPSASEEWLQPEWWAGVADWVGGVIPFELVLGRSEVAAVLARRLTVYPNGLAFQLEAFTRQTVQAGRSMAFSDLDDSIIFADGVENEPDAAPLSNAFAVLEHPGEVVQAVPSRDGLRYGVEFADGRRATNDCPVGGPGEFTIAGFHRGEEHSLDPVVNIVLKGAGSGRGSDELRADLFVWPLPIEGPIALFCEWLEVDMPEQRVELAEDAVQRALTRARPLWGAL